jgi:ribosome-associated protein
MSTLFITPSVHIDESELHFSFARAPGPGGQNVNKVETAVKVHFDVERSRSLPEEVKVRLVKLAGRRMTRDGILVIAAHRFRTQHQNRVDAVHRLMELIRCATRAPVVRKATKPSRAARERRLTEKRERSSIKRMRREHAPTD